MIKRSKGVKGAVCLTAILCLGQSSVAFAANKDLSNENKIPAHMAPGTVITFNKDKEVEVLRQGDEESDTFSPQDINENIDEDLPVIKEGMTIVYDALGAPIVVGPSGTDTLSVDVKEVDPNSSNEPEEFVALGAESGTVSWYDIMKERETASRLKATDGAAHKTIAFKTSVAVTSSENKKGTTVRILDRGPYVTGRILDMSKETFGKLHPLSKGLFKGSIRW